MQKSIKKEKKKFNLLKKYQNSVGRHYEKYRIN
jgi:hypothetical protein